MTADYSIRDLEKLSGIKAHTIRIWEKRYNLLSPDRTDTNIRHYSNEDLRKLLNVSVLINHGKKISHISKLSDSQVNHELQELRQQEVSADEYLPSAHQSMTIALMEYDEESFNKAFAHAVLKLGFLDAVVKVMYPVLDKIGMLWSTGKIMPAQEHFISNLIRQKIISAIDSFLLPQTVRDNFLLFLPEGEFHELPLLMANYLIRASGRKTIYLGQSVPFENVIDTFKACHPRKILLCIITPEHAQKVGAYLKKLSGQCKNAPIFLCGNQKLLSKTKLPEGVRWLKTIEELQSILK